MVEVVGGWMGGGGAAGIRELNDSCATVLVIKCSKGLVIRYSKAW
jgi:hypothetical protein